MSAEGVTDALVAAVDDGAYDVIMANYANPDMVGHTGDWDAAVARPARSSTGAWAGSRTPCWPRMPRRSPRAGRARSWS